MELLTKIGPNLRGDVGQGGEIAQMLMTLEEDQERQLRGRSSRMRGDKGAFLLGQRIQRLEFAGCEGWGEAGIGGAFDGSHRRVMPPGVSEKGSVGRHTAPIVFPGGTGYRKAVHKARLSRTGGGNSWKARVCRRRSTSGCRRPSNAQTSKRMVCAAMRPGPGWRSERRT